jgi:hypothetical protein
MTHGERKAPKLKPLRVAEFTGDPIITSETRVTVAPPFVDRRWTVDNVPRVVDSEQCSDWARAAA